ncbi:DUF6396 domain-containing protein, partial [Aquitalea magnusonii]|uniref:SEL1-like repeat protein n=1 Tax=Aquitalea magnusonii TaxID=332411 RepID=UPI00128EAA09
MPALNDVNTQLAFTCAYEKDRLPALDPEADQLYRHARWLRRNNIIQQDPMVHPVMERLYRIATAYGHDRANLDLREMIGRGTAMSADPVKETLDLTEDLIRRGIPGGYYDMGRYLEAGYGVKQDTALANRYYRKAADLGSPEAQYLIGDKFYRMTISNPLTFAIALQMLKCAGEQGHAKAAITYGVDAQGSNNNADAIQAFIQASKAGDQMGPSYLGTAFGPPTHDGFWKYSDLGFKPDPERVRRYDLIGTVLNNYTWANPKVPELDSIVPLPPAPLPPWDGKIQWLKDFEANVPPPLPTEQRIRELAAAK